MCLMCEEITSHFFLSGCVIDEKVGQQVNTK